MFLTLGSRVAARLMCAELAAVASRGPEDLSLGRGARALPRRAVRGLFRKLRDASFTR